MEVRIVVGAPGTVSKSLEKRMKELKNFRKNRNS